jgi:hypothetical protein
VSGLRVGCVCRAKAGPLEAGPLEGLLEAGPLEGLLEAGPLEAGPLEAGPLEAGPLEGLLEAGLLEAGLLEASGLPPAFAGRRNRHRDGAISLRAASLNPMRDDARGRDGISRPRENSCATAFDRASSPILLG